MKKGKVLIDINDVIGKRLGKLEVISYAGRNYDMTAGGERARHYYKARCDCGGFTIIQRGQITSEIVKSCGCLRKERSYGN